MPYDVGMSNPAFTLDGEHETQNGWLYTFSLLGKGDSTHHELTLSWVDHEHLVGGSIAPERVAFACFALATESFGDSLPPRFDVSVLRRRLDHFDERVRERIEAPL